MFFIVDARKRRSPGQERFIWQRLWEMRDVVPVSGMLPATVSSPCPLLPDEAADAILDSTGTMVPCDTAWAPAQLDLDRYASPQGEIRLDQLDAALIRCVACGEAVHDRGAWPTSTLAGDSRMNRRLAVWVRGWGSLVARRGADPGELQTLRDLEQLARHVHDVLREESQRLAEERGHCAAIDVAGSRVLQHGDEMHARWRQAISRSALRNRNLLTLSPWDVFPGNAPADLGFQNLLPLLACADSVTFRRDTDISHWKSSEFKGFYKRVGAIMRQNSDLPLIAKQV